MYSVSCRLHISEVRTSQSFNSFVFASLWTCSPDHVAMWPCDRVTVWPCDHVTMWLTQTGVAAEQVQDALAALPLVPAALTCAPLRHLGAAVAHVVGGHDGAWLEKRGNKVIFPGWNLKNIYFIIFPLVQRNNSTGAPGTRCHLLVLKRSTKLLFDK